MRARGLGLKAALTHSNDRQWVRQEPTAALVEASSIEDTKIAEDNVLEALELVHPAVLMEQHLIIHLSFYKSEGGDQMSPVGKPKLISQTLPRLRTTQEPRKVCSWPDSHIPYNPCGIKYFFLC